MYQAYNGETVTFKRSQSLDASKIVKVEDEAVLNRLIEPAARDNIYMIDLGAQDVSIPDFVNNYSTIDEKVETPVARFYLNGKALHEARWPNDSDSASEYFTSAVPQSTDGYNAEGKPVALLFTDTENRSSSWKLKADESSIIGAVGYLWRQECLKIGSVDSANKIVYTSEEAFDEGEGDPTRYIYFSNIFEELDAPGESYIDRDNEILYFYHEGDLPKDSTLEFANNWSSNYQYNDNNIIIFNGASNITFSGIDFKFSSDSMIRIFQSSNSITIENAEFSGGGREIVLEIRGGSNHKIRNCVFEDYVGTAISLTGGDRASLSSSGTVISNNIFRKNLLCLNAVEVTGVGHILSHNEFCDIGKAAVRFTNTNNCVFEYNKVKNAQRIGDDGGALYWGRNISELGNIVRYNCFEDIDSGLGANSANAIFIDDGGAGPEIYGNIFNNAGRSASGPIRTNGGNNIYVHDNIIMNSKSAGCMKGWANSRIGLSIPNQPAHTWLSHNAFLNGLGDGSLYKNNPDYSFAEEYEVNNPKELMFSDIWKNYYTNVEPTGNWADLFTYYTEENYNDCKTYYDAARMAIDAYNSASRLEQILGGLESNKNTAINNLKNWVEQNLPQIITNRWKNNVYINVEELNPVNRTDVENDPSPNGAIVENNLNLGTDTSVFSDYILTDEALATIRESIPAFENPDYSMMGVQK